MELYVSVFAILFATAYGCSAPGRDRSDANLEEKVYKSDYVVYGNVMETIPDSKTSEVYSAIISVKCTYKGGMLPINITVLGAGKMPLCPEVNLHKAQDYIILLKRRTDGKFDPEFGAILADPQMIDEILIVCDLELTYTKGSQAEKYEECPEVFEDETCLRFQPANSTTQVPRITTKDILIVQKHTEPDDEPEGEPEPDDEKVMNDSDQTKNKPAKPGPVMNDKGNGKELYSLSMFLLFTCTAVTSFHL